MRGAKTMNIVIKVIKIVMGIFISIAILFGMFCVLSVVLQWRLQRDMSNAKYRAAEAKLAAEVKRK